MSPSTRRAWMEISHGVVYEGLYAYVALHPEGVDRNLERLSTTA